MKVLITGGTGTVGGHLVRELRNRHVGVRVLTRKSPQPGKLSPDVEVAIGDMLNPALVGAGPNGEPTNVSRAHDRLLGSSQPREYRNRRSYCLTSSTRRFLARPPSFSFEATGAVGPSPKDCIRLAATL